MSFAIIMPDLSVTFEYEIRIIIPRRINHSFIIPGQYAQRIGKRLLLRYEVDGFGDKFQRDQILEKTGRDPDKTTAKSDQIRPAIECKPSPNFTTRTKQADRAAIRMLWPTHDRRQTRGIALILFEREREYLLVPTHMRRGKAGFARIDPGKIGPSGRHGFKASFAGLRAAMPPRRPIPAVTYSSL